MDVFGISYSTSIVRLRRKYKKLMRQHHPDKGGSTEESQKITDAYATLTEYLENFEIPLDKIDAKRINHMDRFYSDYTDKK